MTFPSGGGIANIGERKEKDVQLKSCKLTFVWGKMRTTARKAASQIALTGVQRSLTIKT